MPVELRRIFRIVDANLNRSREGLRVIEDIARFYLNHAGLARSLKLLRHQLSLAVKQNRRLLVSRKAAEDVGRKYSSLEKKRKNIRGLLVANFRRVEESLRVLEEVAKIALPPKAGIFKRLRFRMYSLEQKVLLQL